LKPPCMHHHQVGTRQRCLMSIGICPRACAPSTRTSGATPEPAHDANVQTYIWTDTQASDRQADRSARGRVRHRPARAARAPSLPSPDSEVLEPLYHAALRSGAGPVPALAKQRPYRQNPATTPTIRLPRLTLFSVAGPCPRQKEVLEPLSHAAFEKCKLYRRELVPCHSGSLLWWHRAQTCWQ
jgi:hypothetical protein